MAEDMNISVNGQSKVPPGFRFHPTEEELLQYYLRKKVSLEKIDLDVIRDVDLNKLEPWDIQEKCRIGTTPQNDWYFFCHKDKKYPTGTRTNRATAAGFWKATGRDKIIFGHGKRIGMRKTLVFYKGRAPHGQKSDWIMHEYRLEDDNGACKVSNNQLDQSQEDGLVVCRIFKKKSHQRALDRISSSTSIVTRDMDHDQYDNDGSLEQILEQMGSSLNKEDPRRVADGSDFNGFQIQSSFQPSFMGNGAQEVANTFVKSSTSETQEMGTGVAHWSALDHLVASQLCEQSETNRKLEFFNNAVDSCNPNTDNLNYFSSFVANKAYQAHGNEVDLWYFSPSLPSRSVSLTDPLLHLPNYDI